MSYVGCMDDDSCESVEKDGVTGVGRPRRGEPDCQISKLALASNGDAAKTVTLARQVDCHV